MASDYFEFKRFKVWHNRCAMKVGTDGVLLGAWAHLGNSGRILDIGCGSGLLSLMIAQRHKLCSITGIDIDEDAVSQARENAQKSPFENSFEFSCVDVVDYRPNDQFDCIVSNPPFYDCALKSPDLKRSVARQTDSLSFECLVNSAVRLLKDDGVFNVIIPFSEVESFVKMAAERGMYLVRQTDVQTKSGVPPKRSMLLFSRKLSGDVCKNLLIISNNGVYTEDYISLTRDYYLHF